MERASATGPGPSHEVRSWKHRRGQVDLSRPAVMGVVNATPDSFSDGGRWTHGGQSPELAALVAEVGRWVAAGVDVVDVGGESTRPGSEVVAAEVELGRVLPVIRALREQADTAEVVITVDTRHAAVARAALEAGADAVNDVSGLADPRMAEVVAAAGAGLIVGHLRGEPRTMMEGIAFVDLLPEVAEELERSVGRAHRAGVSAGAILVDPGVGFGKDVDQSAALVGAGAALRDRLSAGVLIGASRKRLIGEFTGRPVRERLAGSLAAALFAMDRGAVMVRVHDVIETLDARAVWLALRARAPRPGR